MLRYMEPRCTLFGFTKRWIVNYTLSILCSKPVFSKINNAEIRRTQMQNTRLFCLTFKEFLSQSKIPNPLFILMFVSFWSATFSLLPFLSPFCHIGLNKWPLTRVFLAFSYFYFNENAQAGLWTWLALVICAPMCYNKILKCRKNNSGGNGQLGGNAFLKLINGNQFKMAD